MLYNNNFNNFKNFKNFNNMQNWSYETKSVKRVKLMVFFGQGKKVNPFCPAAFGLLDNNINQFRLVKFLDRIFSQRRHTKVSFNMLFYMIIITNYEVSYNDLRDVLERVSPEKHDVTWCDAVMRAHPRADELLEEFSHLLPGGY